MWIKQKKWKIDCTFPTLFSVGNQPYNNRFFTWILILIESKGSKKRLSASRPCKAGDFTFLFIMLFLLFYINNIMKEMKSLENFLYLPWVTYLPNAKTNNRNAFGKWIMEDKFSRQCKFLFSMELRVFLHLWFLLLIG